MRPVSGAGENWPRNSNLKKGSFARPSILGNRVNIQDGAVIHATYEKTKTIIGNDVSIGHNAIVHGCILKDNVLVGMGSIVMDNCMVESNSIIATGSVVTQNTHVPAGTIYAGVPARKIKDIDFDHAPPHPLTV